MGMGVIGIIWDYIVRTERNNTHAHNMRDDCKGYNEKSM